MARRATRSDRDAESDANPSLPPSDQISAQLAAIVDSSDDAIISKDLQGIIRSWNPAAERMFGYTAEEAVGKSIRIIIPADRQAEEDDVIARITRGEAVEHFETVRRRKNGAEIFISLTVSPIRDGDGVVIGASKIARDITERKRESQRAAFLADIGPLLVATLDYEATLRNIARLATSPSAHTNTSFADYSLIDIIERDGTLRRVAAAHRDPNRQGILEEARKYPPDPDRSPLARPLRTGQPMLLSNITTTDVESMSLDAYHARLIRRLAAKSLIAVPLTARGTTFGIFTLARSDRIESFDTADLAFAMEVAHRAGLAVDNARLYAESQQAVQAREQVLAVVSHDLRNALGVIATSAYLLLVAPADEEQRRRRLEIIARVTDQTTRLLQDLLDVSRLQGGQILGIHSTPQKAASLVTDVCDRFREQVDKKLIAVRCEIADTLPDVQADRDRILQVLSNLVGNAVKFTPEGGAITIRVAPADGMVRFCISDTGPGVKAEDLERLFDPFWQAAGTAHLGTGLGLPIAKWIVEAHGGRIWAESKAGVGAAFHFTVPAAAAAAGDSEADLPDRRKEPRVRLR
jgi:PAS domain S-box-containing protein